MLQIEDLHVQFLDSDHEVVRGIDLTVNNGEIVGLVGESGSGKTVTAMTVAGLLTCERVKKTGAIHLDNFDLIRCGRETLRDIQGKDVSVVFQEPMNAMNPVMRIGTQVEESLRAHTKLPAAERKALAMQALRDAELSHPEEIYRKYPHELSGGMLQRVMIAAAIVSEPHLLIADEPTTALDVTIQAQIMDLILELREEMGMAVLLITHDMGVVAEMADEVMVMYAGKEMAYGDV